MYNNLDNNCRSNQREDVPYRSCSRRTPSSRAKLSGKSVKKNHTSSPLKTKIMQSTRIPTVNGAPTAQKCDVVLVVGLMPTTFIPKNVATKLSGRNKIVMNVKMKMARLLSSASVSTRRTFWFSRTLALSQSSLQFRRWSATRARTRSMPLFSKSKRIFRAVVGRLNSVGSRQVRNSFRTVCCWYKMPLAMSTSSWKALMRLRRRRDGRLSTSKA